MTVVAYLLRIVAGFVMVIGILLGCFGLVDVGTSPWRVAGAVMALVFGGILWMLTVIHEQLGRLDELWIYDSTTSSKAAQLRSAEPSHSHRPQVVSK
jgi:hypothetical protein